MKKKKISIISPCYNEEGSIIECYESIKELFEKDLNNYDYEHIICDNSSTDNSQQILTKIAKNDSNVKVIMNQNNYGSQKSIFNSLKYAEGDAVVLYMPIDLQEPPKLIVDFVKYWEEGFDIVYGYIKDREQSFLMKMVIKFYYFLLNILSTTKIPKYISNFQLVDNKIAKEMLNVDDKTPFVRVLAFSISDNHHGIGYTWRKRKVGKSKEYFNSLFSQAVNGLISVSSPFRIVLYMGVMIAFLSIIFSIFNMVQLFFFRPEIPRGIPLLIVSVFFLSGIQLFVLGFIGEYLTSINNQVRFKDKVVVKKTINIK